MSNAISIFLRQIVLQKGIPFEMKLPQSKPVAYASLTEEQFNAEIEKGLSDLSYGKVISAQNVAEKINQDYGI